MTMQACIVTDDGGISRDLPDSAPSKWAQLRTAKQLLPENGRFHLCHDAAVKRTHGVAVYAKGDGAWLSGIIRCGSVWICPVCSRRVSKIRQRKIQEAIDNAIKKGWGVSLVTLTFPHGAGDQLADIMEKFPKALGKLKSGGNAARFRERIGFEGECRTLEVTHGQNGWHPHTHSIWFTQTPPSAADLADWKAEIYRQWRAACLRVGLPEPSEAHGVDVRGARYAAEYVAKWGFATELAGAANKRGKLKGRTPFQLLADATEGDRRAGWLWREFADCFYGKNQLFWSRGLQKKLQLPPELTDQELLDLEDLQERDRQVILLDLDTWHLVRKINGQEELLRLAVDNRRELRAWLNGLRCRMPMEDGRIPGPREDWEW